MNNLEKDLVKRIAKTRSFYLLPFGQDSFYRKLFPKTILANEVMIDCPIRPAINIWMALYGHLMISCTAKDLQIALLGHPDIYCWRDSAIDFNNTYIYIFFDKTLNDPLYCHEFLAGLASLGENLSFKIQILHHIYSNNINK